mmetsp:Transcript_20573/g.38351  ORF Transcript_20573/g.38351 Transcript_20573/m.38351 type:complete len:225 (-) Transcript_20573:1339-2013(-)
MPTSALFQQPRGVQREVGQHTVGAGALEGQQALHHHGVVIEPAIGGSGLEHRVLAAHLVGEGRHAEFVLHPAHDVQVGHAGFDHHHVGALGQIQRHLAQCLIAVAGVDVVRLLVGLAERAFRANGIPERPVKRARVLDAVGQDAGVDQAGVLESLADGADAAVHHVARAHHVGAGLGLRHRLAHQQLDRGVVDQVARLVRQAVLAVAGVGVQRHIGQHAELRKA